jgi:hypothetical protein
VVSERYRGGIMHIKLFLLSILLLAIVQSVNAADVYEDSGNIYIKDQQELITKLTTNGTDIEPVLHPNNKWIYFIRALKGNLVDGVFYPSESENLKDSIMKHELWRMDIDGQNAIMLYEQTDYAIYHPSGYGYASIDNIQMSPKGDKVYFEIAEWVTSNALMVMEPDGNNIRKLGPGNETKIIKYAYGDNPEYSGYIVTNQHRYFVFGGSYDWWWLYDTDWNEIGPAGDDIDSFTSEVGISYTDGSEKYPNNEAQGE